MSLSAVFTLLLLLQAEPAEATAAAYRVGPGDVLEIGVEGHPELSRMPTVQTTGAVWLPGVGELAVRGLTTDEIAARIEERLAGPGLDPARVTVRVKEYLSQFVWVRGAVARPGRKPLRSGTRLIDALLDAGGFVAGASGEVVVERTSGGFEDGGRILRARFQPASPTPEQLRVLGTLLLPGDVVTASAEEWITVTGAVRSPGRRRYAAGLTLSRALEGAGGLLPTASHRVTVKRYDPAGGLREIEADLDAARRGRAADLELLPGDEVIVRKRRL